MYVPLIAFRALARRSRIHHLLTAKAFRRSCAFSTGGVLTFTHAFLSVWEPLFPPAARRRNLCLARGRNLIQWSFSLMGLVTRFLRCLASPLFLPRLFFSLVPAPALG